MADQRDELTWVVLELTRQGEIRAEEGTLCAGIRDALGAPDSHPVFVPSATYRKSGHRMTIHLMEGYAFVASGLPETHYFALEYESTLVRQVLAMAPAGNGIRALNVIGNGDIQEMERKLREIVSRDITEGMRVHINQGTYARLEGDVLDLQEDVVSVLIQFRSYQVIRGIPRAFLEPVAEEDGL